mmetsp:Transcript_28149/g.70676  ORF Transcript_28149/g.70676 Transcript_28149/m.70676 type:complete len:83 (-) Transcript_28149:782-1030(-)
MCGGGGCGLKEMFFVIAASGGKTEQCCTSSWWHPTSNTQHPEKGAGVSRKRGAGSAVGREGFMQSTRPPMLVIDHLQCQESW